MAIQPRPTDQEYAAHLREGTRSKCLVCDEILIGVWTDLNGEVRCEKCGMTYQRISWKGNEDYLQTLGLTKTDVAAKHCPRFQLVPLYRDYWQQTGRKLPLGNYLGESPIPREDHLNFWLWLARNEQTYHPVYTKDFDWDGVRELLKRESAQADS
jgi:hypothetical protein